MSNRIVSVALFCFASFVCTLVLTKSLLAQQALNDSLEFARIPIDTNRSVIKWRGTEMRETGSHEGIVHLSEGYLEITEAQITGGYFVVNMHSITVTDIPKSDPVPRRNLTEHLESEDFFYVEKYPTARFELTQTQELERDRVRITGNLSIRDVTESVHFMATKVPTQSGLTYTASFTIDRFEYNISYQGNYWKRITSLIDNTFVDADILITVELVAL